MNVFDFASGDFVSHLELLANYWQPPANSLLNAIILVALSIGNAAAWVAYVNFIHAFPISCRTLHFQRYLHDAMILGVPAALVVMFGLTGPRLLRGGTWHDLSVWHWLFVVFCCLGLLHLAYKSVRFHLRPAVPISKTIHSTILNFGPEISGPKFGPGKYQFLAKLPFNQQFEVDFNKKEFVLETLPSELDGMTILHISDWHFLGTITKEFFVKVSQKAAQWPVDLVCFTGDLIDNDQLLHWIPETLGLLSGRMGKYFILGNHDWYQKPPEIRNELTRLGWVDLSSRCVELECSGKLLQIGGDETPWLGTHPEFSTAADFRILMSHTPDHFQFAQDQGVDLMLSGHTHGGQIQLPIIGPVYSPSRFDTLYASGVFWQSPTLMHVTRGLAGRYPVRYNCPPEVTHITLRSASSL